MIIVVSDLHMSDGTAGIKNLVPAAFTGTFTDMAQYARDSGATEITIVFLGDIYDLIRTERWFNDFKLPFRPWGGKPPGDPALEAAALDILDGVIAKNPQVFNSILPGSYAAQFGFPLEPKRVYVPGNHDRLCNLYPSMRRRVCATLGIKEINPDTTPFQYYFIDEAHGAFARHGHEWDVFNFEGSAAFSQIDWSAIPPSDYAQTPIGDVLACEVASKLPKVVLDFLPAGHPSRFELGNRLRDIFDVRPLAGIVPWLAYQVEQFNDPVVTDAINAGLRRAVEEFEQMPFVQEWIGKYGGLMNPSVRGISLKLAIKFLETFKFSTLARALPLAQTLLALSHGDNHASKAANDFKRLDTNPAWKGKIQYVLYGHTHVPEQKAISVLGRAGAERDRVYLNTGMWRPAYDQGVTNGFVAWKNLTYTIIYQPGERVSKDMVAKHPTFEVWTGALKDER